MYGIILDGSVMNMSAVIGICGENFCSFVADKRKTLNQGLKYHIADDDFRKIYKINDRILIAGTGLFDIEEEITSPLDVYPNKSGLTLRLVYKAVVSYIERRKYDIKFPRNYLIGGKDNKGKFCICEVHFNVETCEVETTLRMPNPPESNFALSLAIPNRLKNMHDDVLEMVSDCITSSTTHSEMIQKVSDVIEDLSVLDDTIGKNTYSLTVQ